MSFEITTAFVQQYKEGVMMLSQQLGARLQNCVMVDSGIVGKSEYFDQVGVVTAQVINNRHGDSPLNSTPHARRKLNLVDYETGDLVDKLDLQKTLNDPTNAYVVAHGAAMARAKDSVILAAMFADAQTGETGSTTTSFLSGNQVAVNSWAFGTGSGNAGLTISKLIEGKKILKGHEAIQEGMPDNEVYCAINAKLEADLLATTEVTSADYNNIKALVNGDVDTFMGIKFVRTELLSTDGSGYVRAPMWVKSGMALGIGVDVTAKISERPDKRYSLYPYFQMSIGATRLEEKKVVELKCLAS